MLPKVFDPRLFLFLFVGFVFAVVAGTLSHEYSHWLMSRHYGFKKSRVTYANTSYCGFNEKILREDSIYKQYPNEIRGNLDFPFKEEYGSLRKETSKEWMCIHVAGPLQTMLTGTIGLLLLFRCRKKNVGAERLSFGQWMLVFLSLFWLRELLTLASAVSLSLQYKMRMNHDEFAIARYLHWNPWMLAGAAATFALLGFWLVTFRFVPGKQRLTFIIAMFTGGITGVYLWFGLLGPKLLP
jgi:hypothetical protein